MLFNSFVFIFLFLPVTLLVFFRLQGTARLAWLLAASFFFYAWWWPPYLLLLLASIGINHVTGRILEDAPPEMRWRKTLLVAGLAANIAALAYWKYTGFAIDALNRVLGTGWYVEAVVLPLAISFFTFHQIAYLVDIYRGQTRAGSLIDYALYIAFFPHLLAGPIVRPRELMPQFAAAAQLGPSVQNIVLGGVIFTIGLFKKIVIADSLARVVGDIFAGASATVPVTTAQAWVAAIGFVLQVYFDFSGYSDMAYGLARMFNLTLPVNFHSPFKAASFIELWQRWHITLSRFLRDYVFIPLGGNRKSRVRRLTAICVTMLLCGLWHGAGFTFLIWGALQALLLVVNYLWRIFGRRSQGPGSWIGHAASVLLTFLCFAAASVFFGASSVSSAVALAKGMAGVGGITLPLYLHDPLNLLFGLADGLTGVGVRFIQPLVETTPADLTVVAGALAIVWCLPNTLQFVAGCLPDLGRILSKTFKQEEPARLRFAPSAFWAVVLGSMLFLALGSLGRTTAFVYFNF